MMNIAFGIDILTMPLYPLQQQLARISRTSLKQEKGEHYAAIVEKG